MWLSDLKLVLPDQVLERGSLRIEDGRIAEIVDGVVSGGAQMGGLLALPGIIDLHGDMLERDIEPRPRARFPVDLALYELDKRLAATGITTAYAAVSFAWNKSDLRRQETATEIIQTINRLRDTLLVDCRVHARFEIGNLDTVPILRQLLHQRQVDLVSIMDHTPGQGQYSDGQRYVQFLVEWLGFSESELASVNHRIEAKIREVQETVVSRDWSIVRGIAELAREHGVALASHDDDLEAKVREQARMGFRISEFPVNLQAAQAARAHGMAVVMGAPNAYRGESNTGNLSARTAIRAGLVDVLATDYFPAAPLQAVFRLVDEGYFPLHEGMKLISQNAADAVGLHDRGRIAAGCNADLVIVEPGSPPRVRTTLRNGAPIYADITMARRTPELARG